MALKRTIGWGLGGLVLLMLLCWAGLGLLGSNRAAGALPSKAEYGIEEGMPAPAEIASVERAAAPEAFDLLDLDSARASSNRMVIKTADLAVVVDDPPTAQAQVIAWVEEQGGYVVTSTVHSRTLASGKRVLYGELEIRVPADRFLSALAMIRDLAVRVDRDDIRGQDVTEEYVDLQARLRNLQAAEEELRRLMEQAANTDQVLNIYRELMQVREQIEVLQGRLRYLQEATAYSEISVEFIPVEADEPISIGGWEPSGVARDALRALLRTGQIAVTGLIWLGIYWLPVLAILGGITWGLVRLGRRWWRAFKAQPPTRT